MLVAYLAFALAAVQAKPAEPTSAEALKKSCDAGHATDCVSLATKYHDGKGVAKDLQSALLYMRKACAKSAPTACETVAIYEKEAKYQPPTKEQMEAIQKPVDGNEIAKPLREGCDSGDAESCASLANMYEDGLGVPVDLKQARLYYKKACDKGNQDACESLKNLGK